MITVKEKMQERFSDRNNRDNPDRRNHRNNGHQDRNRRLDNTIAVADKSKKFSKFKKFEDIENMHCIWHPQRNHITGDCCIFLDRYIRKGNNRDKKEDNQKKDEENPGDKGFQQSKGTLAVMMRTSSTITRWQRRNKKGQVA
jgi:hypothetical protein